MTDKRKVVALNMRAGVAQAKVRALAMDTSNVILGKHAKDRMTERDITISEVYQVLRTGHVDDAPRQTEHGDWQCKMVLKIRGSRDAGVVTIILQNSRLFVKTVEWEDMR